MSDNQWRHRCDCCGRFVGQNDDGARYIEFARLDELGNLETEERLLCGNCAAPKLHTAIEKGPVARCVPALD